jgi:hypothetical protein
MQVSGQRPGKTSGAYNRSFRVPLVAPWDIRAWQEEALSISPYIPVIQCDARERLSARDALTTLVEHATAIQLKPR